MTLAYSINLNNLDPTIRTLQAYKSSADHHPSLSIIISNTHAHKHIHGLRGISHQVQKTQKTEHLKMRM
ncbi:hypothetical protein CDL15_Pgr011688 [Punica granatum]|uniref:Uncharacterized protein n=1 Tax=Punica granatum TaxID=22663 RepID=A0A218WWC3_PUNGR|nr:hypothetical protein CDL15_Pgr011688 [Punica granatum]